MKIIDIDKLQSIRKQLRSNYKNIKEFISISSKLLNKLLNIHVILVHWKIVCVNKWIKY